MSWTSAELRVGHGVCTEGCEGRYAFSARLRVRDGRVTQLTPADRARAPIDEVSPEELSHPDFPMGDPLDALEMALGRHETPVPPSMPGTS